MSGTRLAFMRPITTHVVNPVTRRIAGWAPWFGIIHTVGRKSGKPYAVPMNVFLRDGEWVFALTYGSDVDWVRNVQAAGGCELETRRRRIRLVDPRLVTDRSRRQVPALIRPFLWIIGVTQFLKLRPEVPGLIEAD